MIACIKLSLFISIIYLLLNIFFKRGNKLMYIFTIVSFIANCFNMLYQAISENVDTIYTILVIVLGILLIKNLVDIYYNLNN